MSDHFHFFKTALEKAALLAVACLFALGIGEVLARLLLPPPQLTVVRTDPNLARRLQEENRRRYEFPLATNPNEGLYVWTPTGPRLRANTRVIIENHSCSGRRIEISTNSLGYRNPEIGPKRGTRILFLGDSITFGDYLDEGETFVRRVEKIAGDHGLDWETINAGYGGASLSDELVMLKETGLSLRPDAVVICFYLNDFQESMGVYLRQLPTVMIRSRLIYHASVRIVHFLDTLKLRKRARRPVAQIEPARWKKEFTQARPGGAGDPRTERAAFNLLAAEAFDDWGGAFSPRAWEFLRLLFDELKELSESEGFRPLIVAFPVLPQVEAEFIDDYPQQQLKLISAEIGFPLLDLLPALRGQYRASREVLFYDQCHHTPAGNVFIAREIFAFLNKNLDDSR